MYYQNVVVYISNNCIESDRVLSTLNEMDISYVKKNTSENKEFMRELQNENVYSTPTIFAGENRILGFQKNKMKRLLT